VSGTPRVRARRAAAEAAEHLERSAAWNGLRSGDPVIVSGLRLRGASWEFRARVFNRHNGTESIEVVGGRPGIFAVTGRKKTAGSGDRSLSDQLSLAEAPQLPLS
jgi:hypothetical protein